MLLFTRADNQLNLSQGIEYTIPNVSDYLLSPDGTQVAYIKSPNGDTYNCELWVADKSPSGLINHEMIRNDAEYEGLDDWQGDWILYRIRWWGGPFQRYVHGPYSYYGRNELWKMRADGSGEPIQVTHTYYPNNGIKTTENGWYYDRGSVVWGRFIPGTSLVYFHAHNGNGWYRTFVCNDDGTDEWYRISDGWTWVPRLSPTGNKLLWGKQEDHQLPTIFKSCNVDGTGTTTIRNFHPQKIGVTVLGDGNTLVWHQHNNLYAMDMDGSNVRTVLDDEYVNIMNIWGNYDPTDPQGLIMASNRDPDGNMHLFKMNVDGTGIEQLTEGPYNDEYPTLSPDGEYLSYLRLPEDFVKQGSPVPYPYELVIKSLVVYATVEFHPETLNQKSKGKWVTVYIELPEGYDVSDIDIESVRLNDVLSRADSSPTEIDGGILMVKFDREDVINLLEPGEKVLITIFGDLLDGQRFEGTCTIRVIN